MIKQNLRDIVVKQVKFSIVESDEVDGEHILAKVKGTFFCPNSVSRNNRYYSEALWEKALSRPEVTEMFKNRNMYGTIGHNTEIDDNAMQEGKVSHIVTSARINENGEGEGEAIILNTPTGKILNTVLRANGGIYVSSRGEGAYAGKKDGVPAVDEDNFNLRGWDFVLNPGFLKANPKLAESLEELGIENEGDNQMKEAMEKLQQELTETKTRLSISLEENKENKETVKALSEENNTMKVELDNAKKANESLTEKLTKADEELAKYETLGNGFDDIKEALEGSNAYIQDLHQTVGKKASIIEALKKAKAFKESVDKLGTLSEIKEALEVSSKIMEEEEGEMEQARIEKLAKECGVEADQIKALIAKGMSDEEIKSFLSKVGESFIKKAAATKKVEESKPTDKKNEDSKADKFKKNSKAQVIDENADKDKEATPKYKNSTMRLMESF